MPSSVKNQDLLKAVERLKQLRIVKRDRDIVEKTGYSKGLVSNYLSGRVLASQKFIEKFQEVYKQYLEEKPNPTVNLKDTEKHPELYDYEIPLTEGKRAVLRYPKGKINLKDVEIIKTVIGTLGMTVDGYVINN